MPRQKGADEVFCTSCGAAIKKEAEICPECGVRNENATKSRPQPVDTTVSESWWYGVAICLGLWVLVLVLPETISPTVDALVGLVAVTAWVGLPLSAYFDSKYVAGHSDWRPNEPLWVIGLLVPVVNIVFGGVYLYRRHEVLGVP